MAGLEAELKAARDSAEDARAREEVARAELSVRDEEVSGLKGNRGAMSRGVRARLRDERGGGEGGTNERE